MALGEYAVVNGPIRLGSTDLAILFGIVAPDGNSSPWSDAALGSWYVHKSQTAENSPIYVKVDTANSDDDWQQVFVNNSAGALALNAALTMLTDKKLLFRDAAIFIQSVADGELHLEADGSITLGDGTNDFTVASDGTVSLTGTATVTKRVSLPLAVGGGTADVAAWLGAPSINLDADNETFLAALRVPEDWDGASDINVFFDVGNEIAEDDGDDVSFTGQVRGYADGETVTDAGQAVAVLLDLTGGDEAEGVINRATGVIDYNEGTYPIAANDTLVLEFTANLTNGTEVTGPLHIVAWGIEYTANKLGE